LEIFYWEDDDQSAEAALRLVRRLDQFGAQASATPVDLEKFVAVRRTGEYDLIVSYSPQEGALGGLRVLEAERIDTGSAETAAILSDRPSPALLAAWFVDESVFGVR